MRREAIMLVLAMAVSTVLTAACDQPESLPAVSVATLEQKK